MKKTEKISNKKELKRQIAEFWVPVNFLKLMGMDARPYKKKNTIIGGGKMFKTDRPINKLDEDKLGRIKI